MTNLNSMSDLNHSLQGFKSSKHSYSGYEVSCVRQFMAKLAAELAAESRFDQLAQKLILIN
ncbi:hypothetical protein BOO91_00130 [Vibrio navarrensis]|uniref:hypothetical protein n=1 Tax=Vibrio navarrensis TaxID=29495 RepID=UPI001866F1D4|nr:hypothetical protein [Vibrio navarrensis]MBE3659356.1 hypothetical protein [Vibrio navarrensis]